VALDGTFGADTEAAVRDFQRRTGLQPVDGVAGPKTRDALTKTPCENLLGSCTYYFDRPATRKIHNILGGPVELTVACSVLGNPPAVLACGVLGSLGTNAVRHEADAAIQKNACLAVSVNTIPARVFNDGGPNCKG
jgi:hypothetical protein